jgi:long-chain fatty acid transport protein
MTAPFSRTRIATALAGVALALAGGQAFGSAFALSTQNVMGLGNAYAGAAATAEDANTVWHNPAGLARLNFPQVEQALHVIIPSAKFSNANSQAALGQPLGGTGGNAGGAAFIPNLYGSMAINDKWHVGIGINVPFGLKTDWDDGWLGRYQALKSEIKTINVNPAVSYKVTKDFWLGAGASYQHVQATLTNNVNYTGALAQGYGQLAAAGQIPASAVPGLIGATSGLDSFQKVTGDDYAWGWNVGLMYSFNGDANNDVGAGRIGLAYRSKIKYDVRGSVNVCNPVAAGATPPPGCTPQTIPTLTGALAPFNPAVAGVSNSINTNRAYNGGVSADLTMPDMASLSYFQKLNDQWDILGDVTWTGWSSIPELRFVRTDGPAAGASTVLPENFKNTWRFSAGVNYQYSEKIVLRGGVAYDQSPVNDTDRSARLPDSDRTWIALGARYKYSSALNFDVGAAYEFVKDGSINNSGNPASTAANGLINGNFNNHVIIVSAQANYRWK